MFLSAQYSGKSTVVTYDPGPQGHYGDQFAHILAPPTGHFRRLAVSETPVDSDFLPTK